MKLLFFAGFLLAGVQTLKIASIEGKVSSIDRFTRKYYSPVGLVHGGKSDA